MKQLKLIELLANNKKKTSNKDKDSMNREIALNVLLLYAMISFPLMNKTKGDKNLIFYISMNRLIEFFIIIN
jgi:hypothetical protein